MDSHQVQQLRARLAVQRARAVPLSAVREDEVEIESLANAVPGVTEVRLTPPNVAARHAAVAAALAQAAAADHTDLCFCVDSTGSMDIVIDEVKNHLNKVVEQVSTTNPGLKLRVAGVFYRDPYEAACAQCTDGGNEYIDFTSDISAFCRFVDGIRADGGGDKCEDVAGGLLLVSQLAWQQPTKVLVHITDAPSHGSRYNGGCLDDHPDGDYNIPSLLRGLSSSGVRYVFARMDACTDVMVRMFNADVGSDYVKIYDMPGPGQLTSIVRRGMRGSIRATLTSLESLPSAAGGERPATPRTYRITPERPSWQTILPRTVAMFINEQLALTVHGAVDGLKKPMRCVKSPDALQARIAPNPFAEGAMRLARYAQVSSAGGKWNDVVVKDFKLQGGGVHDQERYLRHMEEANLTSQLAKLYVSVKPPNDPLIKFLSSAVVTVSFESSAKQKHYFMEQFLSGAFTKFCDNNGMWDEDVFHPALARFALWTHEVSSGYLMVADLQGVQTQAGAFTLTDPVVLCADLSRFSSTNLGKEGITKCFAAAKQHLMEWESRASPSSVVDIV